MISVGILGGSGYTGKYLVQFCQNHQYITNYTVYAKSTAGKGILSVFPDLLGIVEDSTIACIDELSYNHDAYFVALPHGEALQYIPALIAKGKNVIDLGGEFRLSTKEDYSTWYHLDHTTPELLQEKVYGLADYTLAQDDSYKLIANPGCYPTAVLLGILPLAERFIDAIASISTVAYSGTSGAGKAARTDLLMSEMAGNVRAYNLNCHRHQPEIHQQLKKLGYRGNYAFTTHLLPVSVGIYATTTVFLRSGIDKDALKAAYINSYANSPFVRLREEPPNLNWVTGTNYCDIHFSIKDQTIIITSVIDNLIKGAAGQAMQNLNKVFGWEQSTGITQKGVNHVSVY